MRWPWIEILVVLVIIGILACLVVILLPDTNEELAGKSGVVLTVDLLQPAFARPARWAYRVRLDGGGLISGRHHSVLREGDRVRFNEYGGLRVEDPPR